MSKRARDWTEIPTLFKKLKDQYVENRLLLTHNLTMGKVDDEFEKLLQNEHVINDIVAKSMDGKPWLHDALNVVYDFEYTAEMSREELHGMLVDLLEKYNLEEKQILYVLKKLHSMNCDGFRELFDWLTTLCDKYMEYNCELVNKFVRMLFSGSENGKDFVFLKHIDYKYLSNFTITFVRCLNNACESFSKPAASKNLRSKMNKIKILVELLKDVLQSAKDKNEEAKCLLYYLDYYHVVLECIVFDLIKLAVEYICDEPKKCYDFSALIEIVEYCFKHELIWIHPKSLKEYRICVKLYEQAHLGEWQQTKLEVDGVLVEPQT